jgi:hypothetical protein
VSWEAKATGHTAISKVNTAVNGNDKVDVKGFIIFLLLSNGRNLEFSNFNFFDAGSSPA